MKSPTVYLVSSAGNPNFGDDFITRAWLDWLRRHHPRVNVWLDCHEPGRAAHLFNDTHPRLRTTNTLWQLSHRGNPDNPVANEEYIRRAVQTADEPQLTEGLQLVRGARSVHLLGGGYLNTIWRRNLNLLSATSELRREFGTPVFATGQGLLPQDDGLAQWSAQLIQDFDFVESRDPEGAERLGVRHGADDAFLAFGNGRVLAHVDDAPQVMILLQGDFSDGDQADALIDLSEQFVAADAAVAEVGVVEGMPGTDTPMIARLSERLPHVRRYSFSDVWRNGLPVHAGQRWITTRYHFHLLAAALGASGVAVPLLDGYYDIKHQSLTALGTGWTIASVDGPPPDASRSDAFRGRVEDLARGKQWLASQLYPRFSVTGVRSATARLRSQLAPPLIRSPR